MVWQPGQSGNPAGRPKAVAAMARAIRDATNDGADLVKWALKIWLDPTTKMVDRRWAHDWLTERGFGKALQAIDLQVGGELGITAMTVDVSTLSIEQIQALALIGTSDDPSKR